MLDVRLKYGRRNNIVFLIEEDGSEKPLYEFTFSTFPDFIPLKIGGVEYMNKYMKMYPTYYKKLHQDEKVDKRSETLQYLYEYYYILNNIK